VAEGWRDALPNGASPYYSLPAFLVRAGNPKNIRDWDDLARDDVAPVFPNPKTSGNARYTYLAAYAYGLESFGGDHAQTQEFVTSILSSVPVFDTGGRAATQTFAERNIGDVLVTFEAETGGIAAEFAAQGLRARDAVAQPLRGLPRRGGDRERRAQRVDRTGHRLSRMALHARGAAAILAQYFYRVTDEDRGGGVRRRLPDVRLVTVDDVFGGWDAIRAEHLADGAILDQVFVNQ
jgi:sulfate/thiosulfate transport system substrate-binding protein